MKVYIDGQPVTFRREKAKEYLAYLVDRGTLCTGEEIAAALWEDAAEGSVRYFHRGRLRRCFNQRLAAAGHTG